MAEGGGRFAGLVKKLREAGLVLLLCILGYAHYGWAIEPLRQLIASDDPAPATAIGERNPPHNPPEENQGEPADHDFWGQARPRFDIPFRSPDAYPNTGEGAEHGDKKASEDWGNLSDEWMVYLTGGMFLLALGQLCLFGWQLWLMSKGMKDAEMALDIAKQSANAASGTTLGFIAVWTGNGRGFSIFGDQHDSQYSYYRQPEDAD